MTQNFVAGQTLTAEAVNAELAMPTGSILPYVGASAPPVTASGVAAWLLCDGSPVSRTTYATLFTALGGTSSPYGLPGGVGGSTFNLPDLRGRIPMGSGIGTGHGTSGTGAPTGGTALTSRSRGQWGGDERMPQHNHGVTDPGHFHATSAPYHLAGGSGGNNFRITDGSGSFVGAVDANSNTRTTGITVNQEGTGQGGNMPPFVVVTYIIKT